ncbi:MAG: hypothetical protein A2600_09180 [Candidatus Lambdaproteobacteria bacterium RIFOXYD1_FULL_56_27]|uniref:DUF2179 domain-containing protein n=1 Tax=Candidatus Lambdaproteobacteria bacterium RIFOXYD2_FULL_56_26 TaxID=1817773 RepID=A0A1F6GL82_9PROT|nr:MAG: hypothetical protein A2557_13305 [Candidatus Lambdaproteobacteria bacterium RIFOXYD2_FULL_56_26]OGH03590.1 MAG: hypothetical protein A2426_06495 [Candidatus Lambdaproteobacteria bacterium RIFOXYC1_FULL_56_13]OGH08727.1 MAG: hypothetical protein A2600_09180 [Candidatus Lambdaproteobacteria bacterium RIFOXYD1_FULL_56_27]
METPKVLNFFSEGQWAELLLDLRRWSFWRTLLSMVVGITIFALAINGLVIQNHLFAGGLTGVALVFYYLTGKLSLGVIYFLLNIPLLVLSYRKLTLKYVVFSVLGMVMASLALHLTAGFSVPLDDPLMGAVIAGLVVGTGNGIYFRFGGSAGGLDILATYLRKRLSIPLGTTFNLFNLAVLVCSYFLRDIHSTFYSGIFIFCSAWMVDKVQSGFSQRNAVMIISDEPQKIAQAVIERLDRGVTFLHGTGAYRNHPTEIIYTVINSTETGRLKDLVYELDPHAFVTVLNTLAVIGKRFLTWEDAGYRKPAEEAGPDGPSSNNAR